MPEENYIIVEEEVGKSDERSPIYVGEGEIDDWEKRIGKTPTAEHYNVLQLRVSRQGGFQDLEIADSAVFYKDNPKDVRYYRASVLEPSCQLNDRTRSLLRQILADSEDYERLFKKSQQAKQSRS